MVSSRKVVEVCTEILYKVRLIEVVSDGSFGNLNCREGAFGLWRGMVVLLLEGAGGASGEYGGVV